MRKPTLTRKVAEGLEMLVQLAQRDLDDLRNGGPSMKEYRDEIRVAQRFCRNLAKWKLDPGPPEEISEEERERRQEQFAKGIGGKPADDGIGDA